MHPFLIGRLSSYSAMMALGVIAAVVLFRVIARRAHTPAAIYDHYSLAGVVSIMVGLCSAFLFQSIYDCAETGEFKLGGLTFMGGLAGGALCFIGFGLLSGKAEIRRALLPEAENAAPCIAIAHALGRIGCFLAGCCYGKDSETFGLYFSTLGRKVIPTQLYESAFLFVLFGVLLYLSLRKKPLGINLIVYAYSYSVFRFIIEFFRNDHRGAFAGIFSPSQVFSMALFAVAVVLTVFRVLRPAAFLPAHAAKPDTNSPAVGDEKNIAGTPDENDNTDNTDNTDKND